jgi:cytochrome c oxidase subunit 2
MNKQGQLPSCSTCHSTGHDVIVGPGLGGLRGVADKRVNEQSAIEYIHTSILDPGAFVVSGFENMMPSAYSRVLSEQDIADLTAYLLTLS